MNKLNNQSNFSNGFTFIEILVVIGIIGILVAMIVPSFSRVGGSEALDTTTVTIISVLNGARSSAISSKDAADYGVRISNNKLTSFKNSFGTENKEVTISNLVSVSTSTGIGSDVIFNNVSGETNASGTITVSVNSEPTKNNIIKIYSTGVIEKL